MTISERDFLALRDVIYTASGIHFSGTKKYFLDNRVARRMAATGMTSPSDYLRLLTGGSRGKDELVRLLDEITTNETFFFRNPPQLKALEVQIIPELLRRRDKSLFRKIRIWSAGTSTGEEAYTLAMILEEKRTTLLREWTIEIVGTDLNERVLEQARTGRYAPYAVRNVPEPFLKKYFTESCGQFVLSAAIRNMVQFTRLNLYDDARMALMRNFDIIICANVLIYFDITAKTKIVEQFYATLPQNGYLFVGQTESLQGVSSKFRAVHFSGGFGYQK